MTLGRPGEVRSRRTINSNLAHPFPHGNSHSRLLIRHALARCREPVALALAWLRLSRWQPMLACRWGLTSKNSRRRATHTRRRLRKNVHTTTCVSHEQCLAATSSFRLRRPRMGLFRRLPSMYSSFKWASKSMACAPTVAWPSASATSPHLSRMDHHRAYCGIRYDDL